MNAIVRDFDGASSINAFGWLQRNAPQRFDRNGMDGLADFLRSRSSHAMTKVIENRDLKMAVNPNPQRRDDLNQLVAVVDGQPVGFSHWSFGQLAQLAKAPANYLRTLPAPLVKDNLEYSLQFNREIEDVKAYYDGEQLRAITGPGYGRVDDFEVVEAVQSILDESRWEPATGHMGLSVTDRSLQMFMIDKANPVEVGRTVRGETDVLYRGLRITNSELGHSALNIEGFLFRSYCLNGVIFGMKEAHSITVRHSKNAPVRWAREVQPAIEAYAAQDGSTLVQQVERLKLTQVVSDDDRAIDWLNNRGLSRSQARNVLEIVENEEGEKARSAWSMVQGITALARSISAPEERGDMERIAGAIWTRGVKELA